MAATLAGAMRGSIACEHGKHTQTTVTAAGKRDVLKNVILLFPVRQDFPLAVRPV
jgi:hypothetical protein